MVAYDGGTPSKSSTATVVITVDRNLYAPVFSPDRYETTILEIASPGDSIATVLATDQDTSVRLFLFIERLCICSNFAVITFTCYQLVK